MVPDPKKASQSKPVALAVATETRGIALNSGAVDPLFSGSPFERRDTMRGTRETAPPRALVPP